jgi:DNA mismatch repair ATPase MutS
MTHHSLKLSLLLTASLFSYGYMSADEATQVASFNDQIALQFITSTFGVEKTTKSEDAKAPDESFLDKMYKALSPKSVIKPKKELLTSREIQKTAFDIVTTHMPTESSIVDFSCIDKLEIVRNSEESKQHLFGRIFDNVQTAVGKSYAAFTLCHPTTDIKTLRNRQQAINSLTSINTHAVHTSFTKMAANEGKSLLNWSSKSPVNEELLKSFYFKTGILQSLNTSTATLEATNKSLQVTELTLATINIPLNLIVQFWITAKYQYGVTLKEYYEFALKPYFINHPYITAASLAIPVGMQCISMHGSYKALQNVTQTSNHLQSILIGTASHIKELKKLSTFVNKNKTLLKQLPSLQSLADFNNAKKHSDKFNQLIAMLNTNTFVGEPSFWSVTGRVLAAYELMKQVKDELAPILVAAGELEVYVAISQLYTTHKDKTAQFCMVDFVENSTTPIIHARNFWNPFIDPEKVVANDVDFDASHQNSILTGPNTGGKSTVIKGIMLNILMAQTFGIAPSDSLTITPFSKLNCFMNISDDIATGASLFKSEVMRAKKLLDTIQSLPRNEFSFIIIDEVFTGTSPAEGEVAALQFAEHLGTYKNNTSIIATHYPKMTELETKTNGTFFNHHVEILRNEDNSLNRTFKLKNGPSFFNVAFDILKEEGLFI